MYCKIVDSNFGNVFRIKYSTEMVLKINVKRLNVKVMNNYHDFEIFIDLHHHLTISKS